MLGHHFSVNTSSTTTLALRFLTTSAEGVPPCAPALVQASVPAVEAFIIHTTNGCPPATLGDKSTDEGVTRAHRVHDGLPVLELSRMHVENAACVRALSAVQGTVQPGAVCATCHHDRAFSRLAHILRHIMKGISRNRPISWVIKPHCVVDVLQLVFVDDEKVHGVVRIPSIFSQHQSTELR